jgi:hypothetical protein
VLGFVLISHRAVIRYVPAESAVVVAMSVSVPDTAVNVPSFCFTEFIIPLLASAVCVSVVIVSALVDPFMLPAS